MADNPASTEEFDLESYISNYTSRTRVLRLLFIANQPLRAETRIEALKLAAVILKQGGDVSLYKEVVDKIQDQLGPSYLLDEKWIEKTETSNRFRQEDLTSQLHNFVANSVKEGIRMVGTDLAAFYYECGCLQDALKEYQRTKDYCATPKQTATMCLNALKITLEMKSFPHLAAYVRRTEVLPRAVKTKIFTSKVNCFHGLKELENRKFKAAAHLLTEVHPEIGDSFNDVATARDIATYGALCALATFDRDELKSHILSNADFKELMEHIPYLRECVRDFQQSEYRLCLARLEEMKPLLLLDLYVGPYIIEIFHLIRQRALIQYTSPFCSISLHLMAEAFNVSINELEHELVELIVSKEILARVDSENKILYKKQGEARNKMFENAKSLTKAFLHDHKALLIRLNLIKYDLVQKQLLMGERKSQRLDQQGNSSNQGPFPDESFARII